MDTEPLLEWEAPEYVRNARTADWYWSVILLGLAGVFASVYWGNYLFGVVVLLSCILIISAAVRPVHIHRIALTNRGVRIGSKTVAYEHLTGFWIFYHHREGGKLLLKSDTVSLPVTVLPMTDQVTAEEIRIVMGGHVPEVEIKIPIVIQIFEELF